MRDESTLSRALVRRFRELAGQDLPPDVERAARLHFLDAVGVGLAAMGTKAGAHYRRYAESVAKGGPASVFGYRGSAAAGDAALINGGLIHSLEYDDTHTGSIAHGSAVLAPTALAAGEAAGASGGAVLRSYALGWEALIRIGLASPGRFQARGFQVTSVGGALVAALMAATISELSEDETVAAVGIALSGASGVFEFLTNGSSVKSMHPGWAAHSGIAAAALACAGMTGPETAIEGRFGLFRAFAGDETGADAFSALLPELGSKWLIMEAAFKFNPCCHYLHPFIEAAGRLAKEGVAAEDIREIVCKAPAGAAPIICEPWSAKQNPATGRAARWSLPVTVAARLVQGRVDLATFESPPDAVVLALAARTRWEPLARDRFPEAFEAEIRCVLEDGTVREVRIDDVYGNASRPAAEAEVRAKFQANASRTLPEEARDALERAIDGLAEAPDLSKLAGPLRSSQAADERNAA